MGGAYLLIGGLVAVGVHGGQKVDPGLCDEPYDSLVAALVLATHVLHEVEQQLPAKDLVPVHVGDVAELRLPYRSYSRLHYITLVTLHYISYITLHYVRYSNTISDRFG